MIPIWVMSSFSKNFKGD